MDEPIPPMPERDPNENQIRGDRPIVVMTKDGPRVVTSEQKRIMMIDLMTTEEEKLAISRAFIRQLKEESQRDSAAPQTAPNRISGEMVVAHTELDALVRVGKRLQRKWRMSPEDIHAFRLYAFQLFHQAAVAGHAEAQAHLFECYRVGNGVQQDHGMALEWLKKSAIGGCGKGCFFLGFYCKNGSYSGLEQDEDQAIMWLQNAVELGVRNGCFLLMEIYKKRKNYSEANKWERRLAELGSHDALSTVTDDYEEGNSDKGIVADYNEAAKVRLLAEDNGATINVRPEALKGYLRAAEHGSSAAQYWLGRCYRDGVKGPSGGKSQDHIWFRLWCEIPTDMVQAYTWFKLASDQGNEEARKEAAALASLMSPSDFEAVEKGSERIHRGSLEDRGQDRRGSRGPVVE